MNHFSLGFAVAISFSFQAHALPYLRCTPGLDKDAVQITVEIGMNSDGRSEAKITRQETRSAEKVISRFRILSGSFVSGAPAFDLRLGLVKEESNFISLARLQGERLINGNYRAALSLDRERILNYPLFCKAR